MFSFPHRFDIPFTHIHDLTNSYIDELRFSSEPISIFREPSLPSSDFLFDRLDPITDFVEDGNEGEEQWNYYRLRFFQYGCPVNR